LITVEVGEVAGLPPAEWGSVIIATGPLTSPALSKAVLELTNEQSLAFFDAIAPIVFKDSVNMEKAWFQSRYDKPGPGGTGKDYINCGFDLKEDYYAFVDALIAGEKTEFKEWEKNTPYFEGCLPIEVMAERGKDTLRFGPMRPVGLMDPRTGKVPRAVIQLRAENAQKSLYNLVGFQTRLKWGTQKEILTKIPGLRTAEFARLGAMHRNTFLDAPRVLEKGLRLKGTRIFCAGQITGAEGYTEALSTGFYAASCLHAAIAGDEAFNWPEGTCVRALTDHLTHPNPEFQPMNFNFGLLPSDPSWHKKRRKELQIEACQKAWEGFKPL
jgi:methylenetetrahydrofolate--tRNA-(uracil-5-)-methyltransferase